MQSIHSKVLIDMKIPTEDTKQSSKKGYNQCEVQVCIKKSNQLVKDLNSEGMGHGSETFLKLKKITALLLKFCISLTLQLISDRAILSYCAILEHNRTGKD